MQILSGSRRLELRFLYYIVLSILFRNWVGFGIVNLLMSSYINTFVIKGIIGVDGGAPSFKPQF